MARLPTVADLGARPIARPERGIAQISEAAVTAPGQALASLGDAGYRLGQNIVDREDTAAAKERDAYASDEIRKLLYDPQSGFLNSRGRNTVEARNEVMARIEAVKAQATEGLSPGAARKLEDVLGRRVDSAFQSIDVHTSGERASWLNGASEARIVSAQQDSLADPSRTAEALSVIDSELRGQAAREGWSQEEFAVKRTERHSKIYSAQTAAMAVQDPEAALSYLEEHADEMAPSDVTSLRAKLEPIAAERRARNIGHQAWEAHTASLNPEMKPLTTMDGASPMTQAGADVKLAEVLQGPYQRMQEIFGQSVMINDAIAKAGSSRETNTPGSRHFHGDALDLNVYGMSDEEKLRLVEAAHAAGFRGFGFGNNILHVDMGGRRAWDYGNASFGGVPVSELRQRVTRGGNPPSAPTTTVADASGQSVAPQQPEWIRMITSIADPDDRAAAWRAFEMDRDMARVSRLMQMEQLSQQAFAHIEQGGSMDDLPLDVITNLGMESTRALRSYEDSRKTRTPISTDPAEYLGLRQQAIDDPEGFSDVNLLEYVDRMTMGDIEKLQTMQADIRSNRGQPADYGSAASTLMSMAADELNAAGIDTTPKPGSDDATRVSAMQKRLVDWQDSYIAENGRKPTQTETLAQIRQEMIPVVINPAGPMNEFSGRTFELGGTDLAPDQLDDNPMTIGGQEVPVEMVQDAMRILTEAGEPVTADNVTRLLIEVMRREGVRF